MSVNNTRIVSCGFPVFKNDIVLRPVIPFKARAANHNNTKTDAKALL
jgi:hypothetical protein